MTIAEELRDTELSPHGETAGNTCGECQRPVKHLRKGKCGTCYMRERRGGKARRRTPLDPEIAVLLLEVPGTSPSFAERVFTYVDPSGDCWEWTGALDGHGYGVIGRGARGSGNIPAHCAMWELLVGPIPEGLVYDHLCRHPTCVFPGHGEIVTAEENKRRGFGISVLYAKREVCEFGHPFDGQRKDSKTGKMIRYCTTCSRATVRASRKKTPEAA